MLTYRPTTALWKIKRAWSRKTLCVQGGQGAGKTIAILMIIVNHARSKPNKEIIIFGGQLAKMKEGVINDFLKILKDLGDYSEQRWNSTSSKFTYPNGTFIKFMGADGDDVGKSVRRDVVYCNEANRKVTFEAFHSLKSRAKKAIIDYNPDLRFWAHDELIDTGEADFLNLTYEDNEWLPDTERNEILSYRAKGYNDDGTVKNEYWANKWRVYGLGEIGILEGAIYQNWTTGTFPDTDQHIWGVDWGYRDKFTLTKYYIDLDEKRIYIKNYCYKSGLTSGQQIEIIKKHVTENEKIIYDSAGAEQGAQLILDGWNASPSMDKRNKAEAIGYVQDFELIVCESPDVEKELIAYIWADKKAEMPQDGNDHTLDPLLYVTKYHKYYYRR